ncbi:MAG: MFS transporter [Planctomycetia bacterium]|nr:MFS transporter [Planctomycetia bacterium]
MNNNEKIILAITGFSHLLVHSVMLVLPAILLVLQKQFDVGLATLGVIATASQFMFGLGALPTGILEKKLGGRTLLLIYQIGVAVSLVIIILSQTLWTLTAGLMLLGLFSSIYHPAGLTIISRRIKAISKGMAFHGIMGSIGLALGPIIGATLTALSGWRSAYLVLGIIMLLLIFSTMIFIPSRKREPATADHIQPEATNRPALLLYYGMVIMIGLAFAGFTTFMPAHFALETRNIFTSLSDTIRGGLFTTLVLLSGIIGQVLGGVLGDKYSRPKILLWVILLNIPLLALMGYTTGIPLVIFGVLLGVIHFIWQPVGNSLIAQISHSRHRGLSYGISFFLSFGIGSFAAGIGGLIAENYGINFVFPVMALFFIPGLILVIPFIKAVAKSKS